MNHDKRNEPSVSGILLAGGSGTRFGGPVNKVLLPLSGKPVLQYSLEEMLRFGRFSELVLVCRPQDEAAVREILAAARGADGARGDLPVRLVFGGATRQESVFRGLSETSGEIVLIQDGARPRLCRRFMEDLLAAVETVPGAAVAVRSRDTVKITDEDGLVLSTTPRRNTWLVQTPQCFRREVLWPLHERLRGRTDLTDDCSLLEEAGFPVRLVPGSADNEKLTLPEDLARLARTEETKA